MDKYDVSLVPELQKDFRYDLETGDLWSLQKFTIKDKPSGFVDKKGYVRVRWRRQATYPAHRIIYAIVTGAWPEYSVDHINGNRSDNRWCNLRHASPSEQQWNTHAVWGAIPFKGVCRAMKHGRVRYSADLYYRNKRVLHRYFATPEDAARAYDAKARELFGEFAKTNFA